MTKSIYDAALALLNHVEGQKHGPVLQELIDNLSNAISVYRVQPLTFENPYRNCVVDDFEEIEG